MGFSTDAPIELPRQDRLGRKRFSEALGKAFMSWRDDESLVIGLFGGWGSGKTSIKNLALHELRRRAKSPPLIVNFNAWLVSRQEQLVEAFFRDVTVALARPVPGESQQNAARRLSTLSAYLTAMGSASEPLLNLAGLLGVPGAAVAAIGVKALKKAGKAVKELSDSQETIAQGKTKTLSELKDELRESLKQRSDPVFVVIDDIDRLASDEICLLFRLIKANADFPRFLYILLCDRPFVASALENLAPNRGDEFLEKIVQVSFDIPDPEWDDLVKLARVEWLSIARSSTDAIQRGDLKRWNELMQLSRPYLRHVRAVRRWMNAVRFSFAFFKSARGFDANPEDLLALELLRVYEPALYEMLSRSKTDLTYEQWDYLGSGPRSEAKNDEAKKKLFALIPESHQKNAESLIKWIFPNARWMSFREDGSQLLHGLRAADRRCFDRYFRFSLSKDTFSRTEIKRAIAACSDAESLVRTIRRELAQGRLTTLLEHLVAHVNEISKSSRTILDAVFEVGDELPNGRWVFGGDEDQGRATNFILNVLGDISDPVQRGALLIEATAQAKGVMIPFFLAMYALSDDYRQRRSDAEWLVTKEQMPHLKEAIVAKINEFQELPILRDAFMPGALIWMWQRWSQNDEAALWMRKRLLSKEGFWQALRSAAGVEWSSRETRYLSVNAALLRGLVGSAIDEAAAPINLTECDSEQRELFALFERDTQRSTANNDDAGSDETSV